MLKTLNVQITSPNGAHNYPAGGLIYCSNCRYILGYLNAEGYQDIRIILRCRCGQIGYIKTVPQKAYMELYICFVQQNKNFNARSAACRSSRCAKILFPVLLFKLPVDAERIISKILCRQNKKNGFRS